MAENKPKISIVVPIYNVEKYLKKCIDSIRVQTFEDFELLLVDDGSPDNCGEICDRYAKEDSRIKVIHKKNGGLSDARNAGIDIARGDYIGFIDSDDFIENDMYQTLYDLVKNADADMAVCGVYNVYTQKTVTQYDGDETFVCNNEEAFNYILQGTKIPATICNKLIKREIFDNIRFPVGRLYEDAFITKEIIQVVKTVAVTTAPKYYYIHREGSITTTKFKQKDMDIIEAYEITLAVIKEKFPNLIKQGEFRFFWANFVVLDRILIADNYKNIDGYKKVVKTLRKNTLKIAFNKFFNKSRRISALFLLINVTLYRKLVLINDSLNKGLIS